MVQIPNDIDASQATFDLATQTIDGAKKTGAKAAAGFGEKAKEGFSKAAQWGQGLDMKYKVAAGLLAATAAIGTIAFKAHRASMTVDNPQDKQIETRWTDRVSNGDLATSQSAGRGA